MSTLRNHFPQLFEFRTSVPRLSCLAIFAVGHNALFEGEPLQHGCLKSGAATVCGNIHWYRVLTVTGGSWLCRAGKAAH